MRASFKPSLTESLEFSISSNSSDNLTVSSVREFAVVTSLPVLSVLTKHERSLRAKGCCSRALKRSRLPATSGSIFSICLRLSGLLWVLGSISLLTLRWPVMTWIWLLSIPAKSARYFFSFWIACSSSPIVAEVATKCTSFASTSNASITRRNSKESSAAIEPT